jgi:hypothetical protein
MNQLFVLNQIRLKAKKLRNVVIVMMMILLIFAHFDERGHFYVMGCQLIRRRRQLGPIGPLHKFYLLCDFLCFSFC